MAGPSAAIPRRHITGVASPYTSTLLSKTNSLPLSQQLLTSASVAITVSTIAADPTNTWLTLSSNDYNKDLMRPGAYLYLQSLVTKIKSITSDGLTIVLERGLPSTSTAQNVFVSEMRYTVVTAISSGTANAILDGRPFKVGQVNTWESRGGIDPISYDASAANAEITFITSE